MMITHQILASGFPSRSFSSLFGSESSFVALFDVFADVSSNENLLELMDTQDVRPEEKDVGLVGLSKPTKSVSSLSCRHVMAQTFPPDSYSGLCDGQYNSKDDVSSWVQIRYEQIRKQQESMRKSQKNLQTGEHAVWVMATDPISSLLNYVSEKAEFEGIFSIKYDDRLVGFWRKLYGIMVQRQRANLSAGLNQVDCHLQGCIDDMELRKNALVDKHDLSAINTVCGKTLSGKEFGDGCPMVLHFDRNSFRGESDRLLKTVAFGDCTLWKIQSKLLYDFFFQKNRKS